VTEPFGNWILLFVTGHKDDQSNWQRRGDVPDRP
jgi:hypothetical protein